MGAPKLRPSAPKMRVREENPSKSKMEIQRLRELISRKIKSDPALAKKAAQIIEELMNK